MTRIASLLLGLILTGLVACSPAPAPVASSASDPSNPHAAEGVDPTAAVRTIPSASAVASAFVCPMHPEVVEGHPGACPKCGMSLVPRK